MPFFYSYFQGRGRVTLADQLQADDPFNLTPEQIVWRLLSTGHGPMLDRPRRRPFFECGRTTEVERGSQWFLVSTNRGAEMITVQEIRSEAYQTTPSPDVIRAKSRVSCALERNAPCRSRALR